MNLVDTPTAENMLKGYYNVYFSAYEGGGIKVKVSLGLADWVTLGISEDVAGAIGDGKVKFALPPGVMAKFSLFQLERDNFGLALGYDYFTEGEYGKVVHVKRNSAETNTNTYVVYGIYATAAIPIRLFNARHLINLGMRYPLMPQVFPIGNATFSDLTLFAGLSLPFSKEFVFVAELENFSLDLRRAENTMVNLGFKYIAGDVLNVSFNLRYRFTGDLSRIINIEYQNILF
jgi:hypothetical protein